MTLCAYVFSGKSVGVRCLAPAWGGSRYCRYHAAPEPEPVARVRPDPDRDLLPFTPDEFQGLAELRERTRE